MAKVRTTISVERWLLDDVDALAKEMKSSRDSVIFSALKAFVDRYGSDELLLKRINAACDEEPEAGEKEFGRAALRHHRQLVGDEDWSPKRRS